MISQTPLEVIPAVGWSLRAVSKQHLGLHFLRYCHASGAFFPQRISDGVTHIIDKT